jgi:hypothetical protein
MTEVSKDILKDLIKCQESPCISIYMSTKAVHNGEFKKLEIEFKNLLQQAEKELKEKWDFKQREVDNFLSKAAEIAADINFWQEQKEGLAVFISENKFDYFRLTVDTFDSVHVSQLFDIKQLITDLWDYQKYYILALSPNFNKLYLADKNDIEEVELENLPKNIKEFLNIEDEGAQKYQSMSKSASGSIFHGEGGAGDDDQEDLLHYLKEVNRVIFNELKSEDNYLLLACDDNLFSIYKDINSYGEMLEDNISGNAAQMNYKELKERGWEIVEPHLHDYVNEMIEKYNNLEGTDKISNNLEEIIEAAYYSKVGSLMINKKAVENGVFSSEDNEIKKLDEKENYDLYNYAAAHTIANGGDVYPLDKSEMPDNEDITAIYRY